MKFAILWQVCSHKILWKAIDVAHNLEITRNFNDELKAYLTNFCLSIIFVELDILAKTVEYFSNTTVANICIYAILSVATFKAGLYHGFGL